MLVDSPDKSWEAYGREDPYFGVCANPRFRRENLDAGTREEFFRTGETYVRFVLDSIEQTLGPVRHGLALDFGSGVGRIAIPLARRFEHVTGVDVSPSMIREAENNCRAFGLDNTRFVLSGGDALPNVSGSFDFVNTVIVLQHIPPRRGYAIVERLLDLVAPGGAVALHVNLCRRGSPLHKAANAVRRHFLPVHYGLNLASGRRWNEPVMQMNSYDLNRLMLAMFDHGFHELHGLRFHAEPYPGVVLTGRRGRRQDGAGEFAVLPW